MPQKTVMIDLDGVLDDYKFYEEDKIPPIKQGAKEFLERLSKNYRLVLFTTRNAKLAHNWLIDNKIDRYFYNVTNVKEPAFVYLDDRGINFDGDFEKALDKIQNFKPYWKN